MRFERTRICNTAASLSFSLYRARLITMPRIKLQKSFKIYHSTASSKGSAAGMKLCVDLPDIGLTRP